MIHKCVVTAISTAFLAAPVQLTDWAAAAAMPAMSWFMSQASHIASGHAVTVHRISFQNLHGTIGLPAVM